ncbi:MAG TPA: RNA-binding protein [Rhizomicrobium sp.]|nr:RNA-binding protein [Rhizomicrobium sp.]
MSLAAAQREETAMRERRCIVTGETQPEARLIRFVVGPDDTIVPDLAAKLPGRGIWVSATRAALAKAAFARAAKRKVKAPEGLADHVERLIVRRMQDDLGLARRAGALVCGFDSVAEAIARAAVLIEASDGAADGRRKLLALARSGGREPAVLDCLTSGEISVALGRENVIHAALSPGQLAERLIFEAGRLSGFRTAGSTPAIRE